MLRCIVSSFATLFLFSSVGLPDDFIPLELPERNHGRYRDELKKERLRATTARRRRLEASLEVMQAWIHDVCRLSDMQIAEVRTRCRKTVDDSQATWQKFGTVRSDLGPTSDITPAIYFLPYTAAIEVDLVHNGQLRRGLEKLLTPKQQTDLKAARDKRAVFHFSSLTGQLINRIDVECFLSPTRREDLTNQLRSHVTAVHKEWSAYDPQYLDLEILKWIDLLQFAQRSVTPSVSLPSAADDNENLIDGYLFTDEELSQALTATPGGELWEKQLSNFERDLRARIVVALTRCVAAAEEESDFTKPDRRLLTVATKGVAKLASVAHKHETRFVAVANRNRGEDGQKIPPLRAGIASSRTSVQLPQVASPDNHRLWHRTVQRLPADGQTGFNNRSTARRRADAQTIAGLLDREVWLTDSQRQPLCNAVYNAIPDGGLRPPRGGQPSEVALLLYALFEIPKQELSFLTEPQQVVLDQMRAHFERTDDEGIYVYYEKHDHSVAIEMVR